MINIGVFLIKLIINRELMCSAAFRIFVTVFGEFRHDFKSRSCFEKNEDSRKECLRLVFENVRKKERNFPQTAPNVASARMPVMNYACKTEKLVRGAPGVSPAWPLQRSSQLGRKSV